MKVREPKMTEQAIVDRKIRQAASAKKYRDSKKKIGFSTLRVWVPDEIKEKLNDLIQINIDQHFASIKDE